MNLRDDSQPGSANIIGAGLIGGSIGMALRAKGWEVSVVDADPRIEQEAHNRGAADRTGLMRDATVTVVAVPVGVVADVAGRALAETSGLVTDVGSAKAASCTSIDDPRFIGGHPMAGSDQDGISGARADLFIDAMWVLTPTEATSETAFSTARRMIRLLGAESIALPAPVHDELVAQVSHVPHLTSAALMNLAASTSVDDWTLRGAEHSSITLARSEDASALAHPDGTTQLLIAALEVGFPVLAALMLTEVALAIASRAAPKMNIMAVGFGVKSMVLFVTLGLGLPLMANATANLLESGLRSGSGLIGG